MGQRFPLQEGVESMWASRYRADVEWSLSGRCELHDAIRGEWRASVVLPLRPCLAATEVSGSWVGTVSSMLVIDTMSNPRLYCSRASPKMHYSEPH